MKASLVTMFVMMLAAASGRKLAENLGFGVLGDGASYIPCGAGRDPCNLYGPNMVCCRAMLLESGAPTNAYCVAGDMCPAEDIIDGLFAPAAEQSLEALRRVLAEDSLPPTDVDSANVGLIACGGGRPPCHLRSPLLECCPDVNMGLATGGPAHAHCVRIGLCPVWNSEEQPAN